MILPSQEIKRLADGSSRFPPLIEPFLGENLRPSSYDLTVGDEYYIGPDAASFTLSTQKLKRTQTFTIPPHAVCFILSTETLCLPADISAKVSLRMTHIYKGMVLSSQPPFDPRYEGKVIVMLHNLSSEPFHIRSGDRLATIEFVRLEAVPTQSKSHRSVHSLEEQLGEPLVSSLTEIAKISATALKRVTWLSSQMLVFAALIVAVLALPGLFSFNSLTDRLSEQREHIKELGQAVENYKRELDNTKSLAADYERRLRAVETKPASVDSTRVSAGNVPK